MTNRMKTLFMTLFTLLLLPAIAWAGETPATDTGDTILIIISSSMLMVMNPGLAQFNTCHGSHFI